MKIEVCEKCKHFTQHYIYSEMFGFSKIKCGHCHKKLNKKKDCACFEESNINSEKEITIMQKIYLYNRKINDLSYKLGTLVNAINSLTIEVKNLYSN